MRLKLLFFVGVLGISSAYAEKNEIKKSESKESQKEKIFAPNAISIGGGWFSVNYDRLLSNDFALGAGAAYYSDSSGTGSMMVKIKAAVFPIYGNYYFFSSGSHRFFATGAVDFVLASVKGTGTPDGPLSDSGVVGRAGVGFEYRRRGGGILSRIFPYYLFSKKSGFHVGWNFGGTF